jgi:hypothetical protein
MALLTLCSGQFLMMLDMSVMNVSMATVAEEQAPTVTRSTARHLVDAHRRGEDQRVVLAGGDLDPIGVAQPNPLL